MINKLLKFTEIATLQQKLKTKFFVIFYTLREIKERQKALRSSRVVPGGAGLSFYQIIQQVLKWSYICISIFFRFILNVAMHIYIQGCPKKFFIKNKNN